MLVFTHMKIADFFYTNMNKNGKCLFNLKYLPFIYGSIKPDISSMSRVKHHLSETHDMYLRHLNIVMDQNVSNQGRSEALGVVIHFMCDYFCKYHAKMPYKNYFLLKHFAYELKLHFYLVYRLWMRSIRGEYTPQNPSEDRESMYKEDASMKSLLEDYHRKEESVDVDTDFALFAINELMAMVLGSSIDSVDGKGEEMNTKGLLVESDSGEQFVV